MNRRRYDSVLPVVAQIFAHGGQMIDHAPVGHETLSVPWGRPRVDIVPVALRFRKLVCGLTLSVDEPRVNEERVSVEQLGICRYRDAGTDGLDQTVANHHRHPSGPVSIGLNHGDILDRIGGGRGRFPKLCQRKRRQRQREHRADASAGSPVPTIHHGMSFLFIWVV